MVLIESLGVLGKGILDYAINNAYLLYKHNSRLHDMTPRDVWVAL